MAEVDMLSGFSSGIMGFMGGAATWLYYGFILLIVLAVGLYIIYRMSFNCKIRIRYLTNGVDQCSDKAARVGKDRDGIEKMIISMGFFKTLKMPAPPPEATSLDVKGKRCFEVQFSDDGGKRYLVKDKNPIVSESLIVGNFQPLNSNDRVFYTNEEEKRIARHQKGLSELISQAIPFIALIIILALVIFGWGDMVEPFNNEAAARRQFDLELTKEQAHITSMLKEIIKKEQVIQGEAEVLGQLPPD